MSIVYILKSVLNGRYYIGSTDNLDIRLKWHENGYVKSTKNLRPLKLVFYQSFNTGKEAKQIEYRIKELKNREIIEKIIRDGFIKMKL
ncbi:MAG: GIY-YIG nuclease family protein [bacterium]